MAAATAVGACALIIRGDPAGTRVALAELSVEVDARHQHLPKVYAIEHRELGVRDRRIVRIDDSSKIDRDAHSEARRERAMSRGA